MPGKTVSGHGILLKRPGGAAPAGARCSTFGDKTFKIQRGAEIESDHIVGDLIRRGREQGVATPLLDVAYVHLQAYQNRFNAAEKSTV